MASMIINVLLCIILPLLLLIGILDKRGRTIVIAVCSGALMCLVSYYLNNWFYGLTKCTYYHLTTTIAPIIEECMKFIPIFIFANFFNHEEKSLLSFAFSVGMGFAIVENAYMLMQLSSSSTLIWILIRGICTSLMHGMSTTIVGVGIYISYKYQRVNLTGTLAVLIFAMLYHATYNAITMISAIQYVGIFIPVISYVLVILIIHHQKKVNSIKE